MILAIRAVEDHSRLIGILPFYRTTYGFGAPLSFSYIRPLGSDPNVTEVQTALILPGEEGVTMVAAEQYFADRFCVWDLLNWGAFPDGSGPPRRLLGRPVSSDRHPPVEMFLVRPPGSWDAFCGTLTRNTREAIRKAHNALKRDGLAAEFQVVEDAKEILALLPRFFDLHKRRAELNAVVSHPNLFARDHHREFLMGIVAAIGADGMVRRFVLRVRGEIVALRLGFVIMDTLYFYNSGFDPAYGKYSVMTRLVIEAFKWAIESGLATINLSSGRDRSKLRWNPEVVYYRSYSHVRPRWRSRVAWVVINSLAADRRVP